MGKCVLHLYYTISQKGEKIEPLLLWSRSLKIIPFDRAYMTSHSLSIVTMVLSRLVYEIWHFSFYLLNYIFYIESCTSIMHCRHAKGPAGPFTFIVF